MNAEAIRRALACGRRGCPCGRPRGNTHCPAHDDADPSLSVADGECDKVLVKDHGGCSQGAVIDALRQQGLWAVPRRTNAAPEIEASFGYKDEAGRLLYEMVRCRPKDFRVRRPNGKGDWIWKLGTVRPVLYRLPELLSSDAKAPVFIPEGEKHVDRLRELGFVSTTNPFGAEKWRNEYSKSIRGRRIVILPDNDHSGRRHALKVAQSASDLAAQIKILELPALPEKGDVIDWIDAGGTAEQLSEMAEAAPEWDPLGDYSDFVPRPLGAERLDEMLGREDEPLDAVVTDGGDGAILTADGKGCVAGPPGVGKTCLLLRFSRCLCAGETFLGLPVPKLRRVLYLMLEGSPRATRRRLRKIWADSKTEARARFHIGHVALDLSDEVSRAALHGLLNDVRPDVLIIDPLRNAHPWDENSSHEMRRLTAILDAIITRYGCALMLAHHDRKRPPLVRRDASTDRLRGSTAFTGWLSCVLSLDPNASGTDRILAEWVKTRDAETVQERMSLNFVRDTIDFSVSKWATKRKVSDETILAAIDEAGGLIRGADLARGLADSAGVTERWIREGLRALVKGGRLDEYVAEADQRSGAKSYKLPQGRRA